MINLGDKVKDAISGFSGIVLARMECLFEATECRVHPTTLNDNGNITPSEWIAEDRLIVIEEHAVVGFKNIVGAEKVGSTT